jgi:hypothetical protein
MAGNSEPVLPTDDLSSHIEVLENGTPITCSARSFAQVGNLPKTTLQHFSEKPIIRPPARTEGTAPFNDRFGLFAPVEIILWGLDGEPLDLKTSCEALFP